MDVILMYTYSKVALYHIVAVKFILGFHLGLFFKVKVYI